jgi:hypothetical protein
MRVLKRPREPEPKSWAELVQQRQAARTAGPPLECYRQLDPIPPRPAGILPVAGPDSPSRATEKIDTHIYKTTMLFEPADPSPHPERAARDHGRVITAWLEQSQREREDEVTAALEVRRQRGFPHVQFESCDYDLVSGVPYESPFKATVDGILKKRETAGRCESQRRINPVSHRMPTDALEAHRTEAEALQRQHQVAYFQAKMSENERRAKNTLVNIITGDLKDEGSAHAVREFPTERPRRAELAIDRERDIVQGRAERVRAQRAKIGCRFNNGRMKGVRDWDIISGRRRVPGWDESVKMKPEMWDWCSTERIDEEMEE